jgi:MarR family transcriptional regulator, transcriptional regulator for hemolysin
MSRRPAARAGAEAIIAETGPVPRRSEPPPTGLGFLVNEVSRLMRRRFVRGARAAELPLSPMEASALLTIARQQGARQARLAHRLDVEPITLAQVRENLLAEPAPRRAG